MTCGNHNEPTNFNSYQDWTQTKIAYPPGVELEYLHNALSEEVGELNGKRAKALRKDVPIDREGAALELGDILWDTARLAAAYGYTLLEVAQMNMDKLEGRMKRGTIVGSGDYR